MERKTFLGFDVTPRKKLWTEVGHLKGRISELENLAARYVMERNAADAELASREQRILALTSRADKFEKQVCKLEGKLRKFDRARGENGKYIKGHETRSAK